MINDSVEYAKALEELETLQQRLARLQASSSNEAKGFTKAGIRKMIARLHEELAVFEGGQELQKADT